MMLTLESIHVLDKSDYDETPIALVYAREDDGQLRSIEVPIRPLVKLLSQRAEKLIRKNEVNIKYIFSWRPDSEKDMG